MYKDLCKQRVLDELNRFFQECHGDKVTSYNFNWLANSISVIFDQHEEKEDDKG